MSSGFRFFVGLHQPSDCRHFLDARSGVFLSVNRLRQRKADLVVKDWIMDSGAFTEIFNHGEYREGVYSYVAQIERWRKNGNMLAAVSQDYMCEPFILQKTGLSVLDHQRLTIQRYDQISAMTDAYIMPVIQGFDPCDYVSHIRQYSTKLNKGAWVGVGSVCKRNSNPDAVLKVLMAIHGERPDLLLHGFGLKTTSLADKRILSLLYTADSMAWSYAARREGRNANDYREAIRFADKINKNIP